MDGSCSTYANMRNSFKIVTVKAKGVCIVRDINIDVRIILILILDN